MNKQMICVLGFLVIILLLFTGNVLAYNSNETIIRQKLAEISSLRERIKEKQVQAIKMCEQFKEQMVELETEIKREQERMKIISYDKAIHSPRINYNLKLIQQLLIYFYKLNDKIKILQLGIDKLEFIWQQAEDDLKIMETLNNIKVEGLMKQINQLLSEYVPEADKLSINIDDALVRDPEEIWNEIIKEK